MPLANADEQSESIRQLLERPGTLDVLRLIANAPTSSKSGRRWPGSF